jgi:hypothetical protein
MISESKWFLECVKREKYFDVRKNYYRIVVIIATQDKLR